MFCIGDHGEPVFERTIKSKKPFDELGAFDRFIHALGVCEGTLHEAVNQVPFPFHEID